MSCQQFTGVRSVYLGRGEGGRRLDDTFWEGRNVLSRAGWRWAGLDGLTRTGQDCGEDKAERAGQVVVEIAGVEEGWSQERQLLTGQVSIGISAVCKPDYALQQRFAVTRLE